MPQTPHGSPRPAGAKCCRRVCRRLGWGRGPRERVLQLRPEELKSVSGSSSALTKYRGRAAYTPGLFFLLTVWRLDVVGSVPAGPGSGADSSHGTEWARKQALSCLFSRGFHTHDIIPFTHPIPMCSHTRA